VSFAAYTDLADQAARAGQGSEAACLPGCLPGATQKRWSFDGLGIHFIHVKSPHEDALPLIITLGWPDR